MLTSMPSLSAGNHFCSFLFLSILNFVLGVFSL